MNKRELASVGQVVWVVDTRAALSDWDVLSCIRAGEDHYLLLCQRESQQRTAELRRVYVERAAWESGMDGAGDPAVGLASIPSQLDQRPGRSA